MNKELSEDRLRGHVWQLAAEIGERNVFHPAALHAAEEYLRGVWRDQGYHVHAQECIAFGVCSANLEITRPGRGRKDEIVLVGAHYDSVEGSPGANDNGSGVAVLLELSRRFASVDCSRTVRFVAFTNEEPPFFLSGQQGSMIYASAARRRDDDIRLMIALETLGYYRNEPHSQRYPPLFGLCYPDRANFIGFVSNLRSRGLMRRLAAAFRASSDFPLEHVATFAFIPGVAWSDHFAFWLRQYRALMVTDTAFYRYPWYHTAEDTAEKLDYASLARVTEGLFQAIRRLANGLV